MALISSYLLTTKNVAKLFDSIITAKAPDVFTIKFLEGLELKSTNDRLFIALLKGLGFLDQNGTPTERYFSFLDQSQSKKILADAIKEAYEDLFNVYTKANELEQQDVKNKLKTLTQGKFSDNVYSWMAATFKALVNYAEWGEVTNEKQPPNKKIKKTPEKKESVITIPPQDDDEEDENEESLNGKIKKAQLHYNIQIHLPESRDSAVYDAIFKSLKKHLF